MAEETPQEVKVEATSGTKGDKPASTLDSDKRFYVPLVDVPISASTQWAVAPIIDTAKTSGNVTVELVRRAVEARNKKKLEEKNTGGSSANSGLVEEDPSFIAVDTANKVLQDAANNKQDKTDAQHIVAVRQALEDLFAAIGELPPEVLSCAQETIGTSGWARDHVVGNGMDVVDEIVTWVRYTTLARNFGQDDNGRGAVVDYLETSGPVTDATYAAIALFSIVPAAYKLHKDSATTLENHAKVLLAKFDIRDLSNFTREQLATLNRELDTTITNDQAVFADLTNAGLTPKFAVFPNRLGRLRLCLVFQEAAAANKKRAEKELQKKQEVAQESLLSRTGTRVISGIKSIWDAWWDIGVFFGIYYWFVIMIALPHTGALGPGIVSANPFVSIGLPFVLPFLIPLNLLLRRIINNFKNDPDSPRAAFLQDFDDWYEQPSDLFGFSWNALLFKLTPEYEDGILTKIFKITCKTLAKVVAILLYPLVLLQMVWFGLTEDRVKVQKPADRLKVKTETRPIQAKEDNTKAATPSAPPTTLSAIEEVAVAQATNTSPENLTGKSFSVLRRMLLDKNKTEANEALESNRGNLKNKVVTAAQTINRDAFVTARDAKLEAERNSSVEPDLDDEQFRKLPEAVNLPNANDLNEIVGVIDDPKNADPTTRLGEMKSPEADRRRIWGAGIYSGLSAFTLLQINEWMLGDLLKGRFDLGVLYNDGSIPASIYVPVGIATMVVSFLFGLYRAWQASKKNEAYSKLTPNNELTDLHVAIQKENQKVATLKAQIAKLVQAWNEKQSTWERVKYWFRRIGVSSTWLSVEDFTELSEQEKVAKYNQPQFFRDPKRKGPSRWTRTLEALAYLFAASLFAQYVILTVRFFMIPTTGIMPWDLTKQVPSDSTQFLTQFVIALLVVVPIVAGLRMYFQFHKNRKDAETNNLFTQSGDRVRTAKLELHHERLLVRELTLRREWLRGNFDAATPVASDVLWDESVNIGIPTATAEMSQPDKPEMKGQRSDSLGLIASNLSSSPSSSPQDDSMGSGRCASESKMQPQSPTSPAYSISTSISKSRGYGGGPQNGSSATNTQVDFASQGSLVGVRQQSST